MRVTITLLGGVAWIGSHDLDPARPLPSNKPTLEVQAVSLDWRWLFIYPNQGVASVNRLVAVAGAPIHFTLTSASVMNAFFIPQLGSMIYTMNGMTTRLNLQADKPGTFRGLSSHFSGDGFANMYFEVDRHVHRTHLIRVPVRLDSLRIRHAAARRTATPDPELCCNPGCQRIDN
jgi:cytochrome o ubiquinol oxidase subunit 2